MSDTPRTDYQEAIDNGETQPLIDEMRLIEKELSTAQGQLSRICQEGFGNEDTIGLEPADDYVLRKLAELRTTNLPPIK